MQSCCYLLRRILFTGDGGTLEQNSCPKCFSKNTENAKFCSDCGLELAQQGKAIENSAKSKTGGSRKVLVYSVLVILIIVIGQQIAESMGLPGTERTSPRGESSNSSTSITPTEKPAPPWYPSDFKEVTSNVAYKSFDPGTMECGYSSAHSCYQIYVVTRVDCTLFVNVNFLKNDVVVDDGIDSASVQAGEMAVLTFTSFDAAKYSGSTQVKFTDVTCY